MSRFWLGLLTGALVLGTATAADKPKEKLPHQAMAGSIDKHIANGWTKSGTKPAALAGDEEFLRRIYLDLAGRVPQVSEAREFLEDKSPDKREKLVEKLLSSPRYVTHWTAVWRVLMMPEAATSLQARFLAPGFDRWLREQLTKNAPYDQMVRDLLTTPIDSNRNDAFGGGGQRANPVAYYIGKEIKPENLAASTSRLFLGVRLECAQCHDHPFADWKKDQFWTYAAFFGGLSRQQQGDFAVPGKEQAMKRDITIPGTEKTVSAKFLDGTEPKWRDDVSTRATLSQWLTAGENPYFARATVNRIWAYFFGMGLIDPVDEMVGTEGITSSHPELLDELARGFVANKFDLKYLIRTIVLSKPYQLSSVRTDKTQDDPHQFARSFLRGLTGEQIYDSVVMATGHKDTRGGDPYGFGRGGARDEFLTKFNGSMGDKSTDVQTSILQALTLMNGRVVSQATHLHNSETLVAVVENPFMTTDERIETLFLSTLSRKPTTKEMQRFSRYVEKGGADEKEPLNEANKKERTANALADVFWVLLNSGEFILNH